MDYLCELPNDAARRIALDSLPPDLNSTYERILSRVNQSNPETQKMVRRALRWITASICPTIEALCEAVSIDFGNTRRNLQAIPDEFEILHWCSSLVRKSADGRELELAHFTVKEFLQQIYSRRDISFSPYRIEPRIDKLIRAKVCLTYLNFEDFDQVGPFSQHEVKRRALEYPFRSYAVFAWKDIACRNPDDPELFSLTQKLFNLSKPNTLISWSQDNVWEPWLEDDAKLKIISSGLAEATALHYAASSCLTKVCSWLIRSGCDVNRNTTFGTPLHCALLSWRAFYGKFEGFELHGSPDDILNDTVDLLLESGADPNLCYDTATRKLSPLYIALNRSKWDIAVRLLDAGAILDSPCLDKLEGHPKSEDIREIVEHITNHNLPQENHNRLLQLALKAKISDMTRLVQKDSDKKDNDIPYPKTQHELVLRTAAEFGQVEMVIRLLEDQKLDVDAADGITGLTALHHAARTDQLGVAQILVDRGADLTRLDSLGRTALHHSVQGRDARCVQFFLHRDADTSLRDLEGLTVWHLAANEGNIQALGFLLSGSTASASAISLKAYDGRTPLLCASANGSKEAMKLLLRAGSSLTETALDGSSPLHYAAESGSLEGITFLIEQGVDPRVVTLDNSSAIHCSIRGDRKNLAEIIHNLLESGADPCEARKDGCTPLHDLVTTLKESQSFKELDCLFAASRILLRKLLEMSRAASDLQLGSELMYLACLRSFPSAHEIVLALLEFGLDSNVRCTDGRTALMAAAVNGNGDILALYYSMGLTRASLNRTRASTHFIGLAPVVTKTSLSYSGRQA